MKSLFLIIVFIVIAINMSGQNQIQKPNIVFIMADDLGWTDLGCYGNPYNETPAIDQLAQNGIRFTQSYACSPVCSPSRAGILTGKHPARLQLTNFLVGQRTDTESTVLPAPWKPYLEAREKTLAELLKDQGYRCGMVGKWHLGGHDSIAPWGQGFDYTRMIGKNGLDYYNYSIYIDAYQNEFIDDGTHYLTDKLTNYGVEYVKQNKNHPFFLYLSYSAPHVFSVPRGDKLKKYFLKYEKFEGKYNSNYAAMIESLDDGVSAIINALKENNLLEKTIVIFTSDNGGVALPELGPIPTNMDPLKKWKGHLYEGGIRVPTIVYWPSQLPSGKVCDQYFTNIDYFPTICDLLNINQFSNDLDGKSILPLLKNPEIDNFERGPIFWHYPHFSNQLGRPAGACRLNEFKLIENFETNSFELYNLENDISEAIDLSGKLTKKTNEMKKLLKKWRQEVKAQMPILKSSASDN